MKNPRLASRYAKSLLDLATEQSQLDAVLQDMRYLAALTKESRDFTNMLRSPIIKADKKHHILAAVFGSDRISKLTSAFIKLLINKGREAYLPEITSSFILQYKELKHIKTLKLTSAAALNENVKQAIVAKVAQQLQNNQIELEEKINPELLGGFVLEMDDKLFDASIRRDLNDVKHQFSKNIYISQIR